MTSIFHITHIDNLPKILASEGLISLNKLRQNQADFVDIAHRTIQDRRARKDVPCGPGGTLRDYVPFYFAPRSPMLYVISMGNVSQYSGGQRQVVYLVSSAQIIKSSGLGFAFTDGHGIIDITTYYDDLDRLDCVDWELMQSRYWNDTRDDPDRKRRRQAEFLVYDSLPWSLVSEVGVYDDEARALVLDAFRNEPHCPLAKIRPDWYY